MTDDVDPAAVPSVPFETLDTLPRIRAIYFALGDDDKVLYVGAAIDLWKRWRGHHHIRALRAARCIKISCLACSLDDIVALEDKMIERFDPPLNGAWRPMVLRLPRQRKEPTFALRLSHDITNRIDAVRQRRPSHLSRNSWIVEAIIQKLETEE